MKHIICAFAMLFIMLCCPIFIGAETTDLATDEIKALGNQLPDTAESFISENNISVSDPSGMLEVTPKMVFEYMWENFSDTLSAPLRMLGMLLIVIILTALVNSMGDTVSKEGMERIYQTVSLLIVVSVISGPIGDSIELTVNTLNYSGEFMASYIPVFAGIVAASGGITSAASYNMIVMTVLQIFVQLAKHYLTPVLSYSFAISIVEAINPSISLAGLNQALKKFCTWGLGFLMTIFAGLLTIQSIVGTSADTLAVKAAKFAVSNFIPIIGGAVSDAYTTIKSSMGVLRSGVGGFGIITLILTVAPPILSVLAVQAAVYIGQVSAEILSVESISKFLKNVSSVLTIALSLLICFSLMLIVSTTIVMMVGMNMTNT